MQLTGYGHVLTLYEKTLDFEKKKEKSEFFPKNENALTFFFQSYVLRISELFCLELKR